jgi:6-phosphogluconolactonase (cycloisomerase 2 family)
VNNGTQLGVANYGGGSAFFTTLDQDLLHFSSPQLVSFANAGTSNAHQIVSSGDQVLVPDLGTDRVWRLGQDGSSNWGIQDFIPQPTGSGPRHVVVDDGALYSLHEKANTLTQQNIPSTVLPNTTQPENIASISIVPSDTPSGATLFAGELLFTQTPTPLIYASNREDPSTQGDSIAVFDINPLRKVADVRTGLQHLRGVALVGENNAYLIAGGMKGGGIKIYERVSADQGYLKEIASLPAGVIDQPASFVWASQDPSNTANTPTAPTTTRSSTSILPTVSRSAGCRRFKIGI